MGHLIFLIIQVLCIVFYALCKTFGWPGVYTMLLLSWILPALFYCVMSLSSVFRKNLRNAMLYFLFSLLLLAIPVKLSFVYYNVILHVFLLVAFGLLFFRKQMPASHQVFKGFVLMVGFINLALLFCHDDTLVDTLGVNYNRKNYNNEQLSWKHFIKTDSLESGFSAHISSYISYRISRVRNYKPATVRTRMRTDRSFYIVADSGLLEHELYHFKLTELTACKLRNALEDYHFASHDAIKKLVDQYIDTLHAVQGAYDKETNHNLNSSEQRRWKLKTDEALKNY